MEISAEKTKLMINSADCIQREFKVTSFKYLRAVASDEPEILSRNAQAAAALTKLKTIWRDKTPFMRSLVISIFLYTCES